MKTTVKITISETIGRGWNSFYPRPIVFMQLAVDTT